MCIYTLYIFFAKNSATILDKFVKILLCPYRRNYDMSLFFGLCPNRRHYKSELVSSGSSSICDYIRLSTENNYISVTDVQDM